jgi:hypothetical protein
MRQGQRGQRGAGGGGGGASEERRRRRQNPAACRRHADEFRPTLCQFGALPVYIPGLSFVGAAGE